MAYRQQRLQMLRNEPSSFGSDFETVSVRPIEYFIDRCSNDPENFIVGAFTNDELIGSCGGFRESDAKRRHIGMIVGMYLNPQHRGSGVAKRLLEQTIAQLRLLPDVELIKLAVTVGNAAAEHLYRQAGFIEYGREPSALKVAGDNFDELLMWLPLR